MQESRRRVRSTKIPRGKEHHAKGTPFFPEKTERAREGASFDDPQALYQELDGFYETLPPQTIPVGGWLPVMTIQFSLPHCAIEGLVKKRYQAYLMLVDVDTHEHTPCLLDGTEMPDIVEVPSDPRELDAFLGFPTSLQIKDFDISNLIATCSFPTFTVHREGHYRLKAQLTETSGVDFEFGKHIFSTLSVSFRVSYEHAGAFVPDLSYSSRSFATMAKGLESFIQARERGYQAYETPEQATLANSLCTVFVAALDLPSFVKSELATVETIRSVLTVSGTPERAFAASCQEYLQMFWPTIGPRVLRSLISSIHTTEENTGISSDFSEDANSGAFVVSTGEHVIVAAKGNRTFLEGLTGVLKWLTAAFQPCVDGKFQLSESTIRKGHVYPYIEISSRCRDEVTGSIATSWSQADAAGSVATCWHRMFEGFNLAAGFPIPERGDEKGAELPFQAMKLLGLIWYPCHYDGKMFLKGDQTALLPVGLTNGTCIQWHFVQADDEGPQPLWNLIKESGEAMTDLSHIQDLSSKRMFVGYWPNAEIHLGTRDSNFWSVELSGAEYNDKNRIVLGDEVTGTVGTSGMGFFTAEVSATVLLHQTANRRIMAAHKRIHDKIRNAKQASTLIYDVGTKRAWLVPELSVILHMILAWASYQDQAEGILEKMPYAVPHHHGGEAAYEAIRSAMGSELPAHIQTDETKTFSHLLVEFFARVAHIKDQQIGAGSRETKDLVGYEFKEISEFQEHIASKRATIDAAKSASWPKLIASRPDIAVLFCSNLVDPIQPMFQETDHCLTWSKIPEEQYFLTASMSCIRQLSRQCGGGNYLKVYNDLYCVPGSASSKFVTELCSEGHSPCYRSLLEISSQPPKETYAYSESGAIVIGKMHTSLLERKFGKSNWRSSVDFKRVIGMRHGEHMVSTTPEASGSNQNQRQASAHVPTPLLGSDASSVDRSTEFAFTAFQASNGIGRGVLQPSQNEGSHQ